MKTIKILLPLAIFAMLFTACTKEPEANFKISKNPAGVNETVTFNNSTVDGDRYEWDFGDGTTASTANATHSYSEEGNFNVTLTAYSKKDKKKSTISKSLKIVDTKLRVRVYDWEVDEYVNGINVELYNSYTDWDNLENTVASGTTNADGYALFTELNTQVYYVAVLGYDAEGLWFDNSAGDSEDIVTPELQFGEQTDVEIWVDYNPELKTYKIIKIQKVNNQSIQ